MCVFVVVCFSVSLLSNAGIGFKGLTLHEQTMNLSSEGLRFV